ncbi:sterol desaturase family protein [Aestuariibaculum lutulentum]|uniref:Sterol desaturase family protein n=1 Tax=Aestuariibaculum lutulentum TaxID=2920935 RepID=A0ABS9RE06_9FLAO|nr:sterol desaturase family protein [Aestuariibaculum lutulentum]MCH4551176.1 sterol desaturase family protein [Aestuariibaculum lutulentum]
MKQHRVTTDFSTGQAQIFKNPFLERLTKTNPASNIVIYGITILLLGYLAIGVIGLSVISFITLFCIGFVSWTLAEYLLHRYLFHWYNDWKWTKRFHFIMHGSHHEYPKDKERLLMPPVPGLILASLLFCIFYVLFWVFGVSKYTFGYFPGFFLGYLMYSFVHRAIHVKRPPKRFKYLWLHHNLHHYQYPDKAYGVSNTFWDKVFGTMPPKPRRKDA